MVDREKGIGGAKLGNGGERDHRTGGGFYENLAEISGVGLEFRIDLENHVVLVVELVQGRDLALAEGVVERVVHIERGHAEARGGVAIDGDVGLESAGLLVAVEVLEFGILAELREELGRPLVEFLEIAALQRVLELPLASAPAADANVLVGAQDQLDALNAGGLLADARDDLLGSDFAHVQRLEGDEKTAVVDAGTAEAAADEGAEGLDGGIFQQNFGHFLLELDHRGKGNVLCGDGGAVHEAAILRREESLGHNLVEPDRGNGGEERDDQHEALVAQHPLEAVRVVADEPV